MNKKLTLLLGVLALIALASANVLSDVDLDDDEDQQEGDIIASSLGRHLLFFSGGDDGGKKKDKKKKKKCPRECRNSPCCKCKNGEPKRRNKCTLDNGETGTCAKKYGPCEPIPVDVCKNFDCGSCGRCIEDDEGYATCERDASLCGTGCLECSEQAVDGKYQCSAVSSTGSVYVISNLYAQTTDSLTHCSYLY